MTVVADKRSVSTDALETLGTLIDENAKRDAIHIAVEPAIAAHTLRPGENVGFVEDGYGKSEYPVGIVDPFLKTAVEKGQRFWLLLYPRQITSLRHVWSHPAFPEGEAPTTPVGNKQESEQWLRDFLEQKDCGDEDDYANILSAANYAIHHQTDDEYLHVGGTVIYGEIPSVFWDHVEIVTGKRIASRPVYFSCSC